LTKKRVLLPAGFVAFIAVAQGVNLFRQFKQGGFYQSLDQIRTRLASDLPHHDQFRQLEAELSRRWPAARWRSWTTNSRAALPPGALSRGDDSLAGG
jgi:hypothetical protein